MEKRVRHGKFFQKWQIGLKQIKKTRLDFPNRTAPFIIFHRNSQQVWRKGDTSN